MSDRVPVTDQPQPVERQVEQVEACRLIADTSGQVLALAADTAVIVPVGALLTGKALLRGLSSLPCVAVVALSSALP